MLFSCYKSTVYVFVSLFAHFLFGVISVHSKRANYPVSVKDLQLYFTIF